MRVCYRYLLYLAIAIPAVAQNVSVVATIDSQSVAIGDWIHLSVRVTNPSGAAVAFPALKDTIGSFDIVKQDSLTETAENGVSVLSKKFVISKYESGNYYVPPITVLFTDNQGIRDSAMSNPIPVEIRGIEVDTTQSIRDIKAPLTVPMSVAEMALYAGIVLGAAGFAYGIYYYIRKKKRNGAEIEESVPKIPPHIEAIQKLELLESEHLWQSGQIKLFYSRATEIVREYFEKRYGIMALEMTTGEVMKQLKDFSLEQNTGGVIERLLSDADLVKFAKYYPIAAENEAVIATAKIIVDRTKPVEEENTVHEAVEKTNA